MEYSCKKITIVNHTFALANTWELVQAENKAVRKWFIKARENNNIDVSFDYDFTATHATYATNGGQGVAFDDVSLPNIYAKVADTAIVLELIFFD